jgi:hypothetical protein
VLTQGRVDRSISYDFLTDEWTSVTNGEGGVFGEGVYRFDDIDTTVDHNLRRELVVGNADPLSARYLLTQTMKIGREGWQIEAVITLEMRSDLTHFIVSGDMVVSLNGEEEFTKYWHERIPR